ncbi:hypothetical protein NPIL_555401 [Nephila pilipes]|uniref:Uncharacterized protein n=1 Tax=Nephila pilipes TaxID=299642 RepID=A0A8X6P6L3_NEPPI|nr:hypothetical protein NPIL_555401 [Nephila pilipes]
MKSGALAVVALLLHQTNRSWNYNLYCSSKENESCQSFGLLFRLKLLLRVKILIFKKNYPLKNRHFHSLLDLYN